MKKQVLKTDTKKLTGFVNKIFDYIYIAKYWQLFSLA